MSEVFGGFCHLPYDAHDSVVVSGLARSLVLLLVRHQRAKGALGLKNVVFFSHNEYRWLIKTEMTEKEACFSFWLVQSVELTNTCQL